MAWGLPSWTQGPGFQVASLAQELNLGFIEIEAGAEKGSVTLVFSYACILLVLERRCARFYPGSGSFDVRLRQLMLQLGHVACGDELCNGALQLEGILADLLLHPSSLRASFDGVKLGGVGSGMQRRVEKRKTDDHADAQVVALEGLKKLFVIVVLRKHGVLAGQIHGGI